MPIFVETHERKGKCSKRIDFPASTGTSLTGHSHKDNKRTTVKQRQLEARNGAKLKGCSRPLWTTGRNGLKALPNLCVLQGVLSPGSQIIWVGTQSRVREG